MWPILSSASCISPSVFVALIIMISNDARWGDGIVSLSWRAALLGRREPEGVLPCRAFDGLPSCRDGLSEGVAGRTHRAVLSCMHWPRSEVPTPHLLQRPPPLLSDS